MTEKPDRTFTLAGLVVVATVAACLLMCVAAAVWQVTHGHKIEPELTSMTGLFAVGLPALLARTRPDPPSATTNVVNASPPADPAGTVTTVTVGGGGGGGNPADAPGVVAL